MKLTKLTFWSVFKVVFILTLTFLAGGVTGYVLGYQDGAKAVITYATEIFERIKIDNFNIELNQTKIDEVMNNIKNLSDTINARLMNGSSLNCTGSGVLC